MSTTLSNPRELLLHGLKDVYYAEQQIVKKLPKLIDEASDRELSQGLERHLEETKQQVSNLEEVFSELGEKAQGQQCPGIEGIAKEHDEFMKEYDASPELRDMFLTGAAARVEHYEMAAYNDLITMAEGLGETRAVELLQENLTQEKKAADTVETIGKRLARETVGASR